MRTVPTGRLAAAAAVLSAPAAVVLAGLAVAHLLAPGPAALAWLAVLVLTGMVVQPHLADLAALSRDRLHRVGAVADGSGLRAEQTGEGA